MVGSNVLINRVRVTTLGNSVAIKPSHNTNKVVKDRCTQNVTVQDLTSTFTYGAAIVQPKVSDGCVRRINFNKFRLTLPVMGVYFKHDPDDSTIIGEMNQI